MPSAAGVGAFSVFVIPTTPASRRFALFVIFCFFFGRIFHVNLLKIFLNALYLRFQVMDGAIVGMLMNLQSSTVDNVVFATAIIWAAQSIYDPIVRVVEESQKRAIFTHRYYDFHLFRGNRFAIAGMHNGEQFRIACIVNDQFSFLIFYRHFFLFEMVVHKPLNPLESCEQQPFDEPYSEDSPLI